MELRMFSATRYIGSFMQITLKTMLFAVLQISLIAIPSLALAQLPTVNLVPGDEDVSEAGPNPGSFSVSRSNDGVITEALTVRIAVTGTAAFNQDYPNPGMAWIGGSHYQFTIPPDQLTASMIITPVQDGLNEADETVIFTLVDQATYIVGPDAVAELTIVDDPPIVNLTVEDSVASESGPDPGSFSVSRSNGGVITEALTVRIAVTGTATFNQDYPDPGMAWIGGNVFQFTIPPDQLTASIVITPNRDGVVEDDETAIFTLVGSTTYKIGEPATASITITDYVEGIFKDSFEDP